MEQIEERVYSNFGSLDEWELIAVIFYCQTGYLRPGKSEARQVITDQIKRNQAWENWLISNQLTVNRIHKFFFDAK